MSRGQLTSLDQVMPAGYHILCHLLWAAHMPELALLVGRAGAAQGLQNSVLYCVLVNKWGKVCALLLAVVSLVRLGALTRPVLGLVVMSP